MSDEQFVMTTRMKLDAFNTAKRYFTILNRLASRRNDEAIGRSQLAELCGCAVKTVTRDIQDLTEAGVPVQYDSTKRTFILPDPRWAVSLQTMNVADVMALALARALLANSNPPLPLAHEMSVALGKATFGLPPKLRSQLEQATAVFHDRNTMARDYSNATLELLMTASVNLSCRGVYGNGHPLVKDYKMEVERLSQWIWEPTGSSTVLCNKEIRQRRSYAGPNRATAAGVFKFVCKPGRAFAPN